MRFSSLRTLSIWFGTLSTLLCHANRSEGALSDELIIYWPLDVMDGNKTPDLVGTNHLTIYNFHSTNLVQGKFGNAFSFNGYSQFMSLSHYGSTTFPIYAKNEFTISLWVRGQEKQENRIVFAEGNREDKYPLFLFGTHREGKTGQLNVMVRDTGMILNNIPTDGIAFNGEWRHIAWVNAGNSAKVYINGELNTEYRYERPQLRLNYLSIGALFRDPPLYFFRGEMDDIAIWQRSLSQKEVLEVMTAGVRFQPVSVIDN